MINDWFTVLYQTKEHTYATSIARQINDLKSKLKATKQELDATKKRLQRREKCLESVTEKLYQLTLISKDQKRMLTETFSGTYFF